MNDQKDPDAPNLDSLIDELRDLKRFIEADDDNSAADEAELEKLVQQENTLERDTLMPDNPPVEDSLPLLDKVIHRPGSEEQQMDLLLDAIPTIQEKPAQQSTTEAQTSALEESANTRPTFEPAIEDAPEPEEESSETETFETRENEQAEETAPPQQERSRETSPQTENHQGEEELTAFVYDLADRIIEALDQQVMARNGEELPADLRREFRETVADILYEWT